jgi:ribonuclease BN (tRNA processing enzyme)
VSDGAGTHLVFDAGSGIRPLGDALAAVRGGARIELFLSHFHWDHIQGLPFFRPLYDETASVRIHGPPQGAQGAHGVHGVQSTHGAHGMHGAQGTQSAHSAHGAQGAQGVQSLLAGQMGTVYFPVPFEALTAELSFADILGDPFERGRAVVSTHRVRHPTNACAFRIELGGAVVVYAPDNELAGGHYDVPGDWYRSLCAFVEGADLLLHDAMFTDAEYARYEGWGHSSIGHAIRLAEDAGVRRLLLFHHSPDRTDAALAELVDAARTELAGRGSALELDAAAEDTELVVEEPA